MCRGSHWTNGHGMIYNQESYVLFLEYEARPYGQDSLMGSQHLYAIILNRGEGIKE